MNPAKENRRLLLIDDNPAIHEDFKKILSACRKDQSEYASAKSLLFGEAPSIRPRIEFETDSAFQGQQGLAMIDKAAAEGRPYAMAFVDVRMPPGWDGIETIARIWEKYKDLQVVVCTAYSDYSWDEMQERLGNPDSLLILKKPFDNVEVLQLAHALTAKWNLTRAANMKIDELDRAVAERTQDLQRSEERFAKAFQRNALPMFIETAEGGRVLDANAAFLNLIGATADQVIGSTERELSLWNDGGRAEDAVDVLKRISGEQNTTVKLHTRSGDKRDVFVFAEEFYVGAEHCRLVLLKDETDRLKLEADLRQAQKMEAVGQLAAGIAHDFNNILTIIRGHLSLVLSRNHLTEPTTHALKQALTASERAGALKRQLLAFSRKQVIERKPLRLASVFEQFEAMLGRLIGENIQVEMVCPASLPPVFADRCNIEQVLINLAVNARDAMPNGGQLSIRAYECHGSPDEPYPASPHARYVCLEIADTGSGMTTETQSHIFEPFFTTKGVGKGTGMGLATVYGIVKQHQGHIGVESSVGKGTAFRVYLPVCVDLESVAPPPPTAENPDVSGDETILLVEDEEMLLEFVREVLSSHGYRVLAATNAVEALKLWETRQNMIALLLTDMVMPGGVTGKQLAERLRADQPNLRVIYSSGYSLDLLGDAPNTRGVSVLQKPYAASLLVKTVRECLDTPCDETLRATPCPTAV